MQIADTDFRPANTRLVAKTISEVISLLDEIIVQSKQENSRLGFFASLYRLVTIEVKNGIENGRFEDGARMELLDVVFANRYLEALDKHNRGERSSHCWHIAFETARHWRPLILQHLLLGINAHINLDLGVAAAQICPGDKLSGLKSDFYEINKILSRLLDIVQERIGNVSPFMKHLDRIGGKTDEAVFNFSVEKARDAAWKTAERLAPLALDRQNQEIMKLDQLITTLARLVRNPGLFLSAGAFIIRIVESSDVPHIIDVLSMQV